MQSEQIVRKRERVRAASCTCKLCSEYMAGATARELAEARGYPVGLVKGLLVAHETRCGRQGPQPKPIPPKDKQGRCVCDICVAYWRDKQSLYAIECMRRIRKQVPASGQAIWKALNDHGTARRKVGRPVGGSLARACGHCRGLLTCSCKRCRSDEATAGPCYKCGGGR